MCKTVQPTRSDQALLDVTGHFLWQGGGYWVGGPGEPPVEFFI